MPGAASAAGPGAASAAAPGAGDALSEKLAALKGGGAESSGDENAPGEVASGETGDGAGATPESAPALPASIFRAYDIRGVVGKTLTADIVREIGRAIGSEAYDRGQQTLVVGCDGRHSGPELLEALTEGLRATGRDVIDIGRVPTPVLYFATFYLNTGSGVMVTGSHNPPNTTASRS